MLANVTFADVYKNFIFRIGQTIKISDPTGVLLLKEPLFPINFRWDEGSASVNCTLPATDRIYVQILSCDAAIAVVTCEIIADLNQLACSFSSNKLTVESFKSLRTHWY